MFAGVKVEVCVCRCKRGGQNLFVCVRCRGGVSVHRCKRGCVCRCKRRSVGMCTGVIRHIGVIEEMHLH